MDNSRRAFQVRRRKRYQGLLQVLSRFDHVLEVRGSDFQAPGIGQRVAGAAAQGEQISMRQGQNFLLLGLVLGPHDELYVHRVGVPDRDGGL